MSPESLLRKAQALGDDIKEMESIDVLGAYYQAQAKIKTNRRKNMYNQLMRYAAFLTIPLFLSSLVLGYLYFSGTETDEKYAEVVTATGSVIRYELPDHSVVWLNAGSTLRYPTTFKKDNRLVELKGEAYFEVQADKERPFYVNTPNGLSVYVYGTQFNVAAYEDDNYIETVLEKGKVNVITPNQETIVLAPGEQLLYDKQSQKSKKNKVDVYGKIAWKDGKLIFRNASLEEILKRLERHFNVEIMDLMPADVYAAVDMNHIKNPELLIAALGSRIKSVHIADGDGEKECHQLPGRGKNNWVLILQALDHAGYTGPFLYEIRAKEVDGFTDLVTAYNLLYENYTKSLQP